MEYVMEIDMGGDGLLHDHAGTCQTGAGHRSGDQDCTDNDTDYNLPDATNCRCPPNKEDAPPVSRDTIIHN